MLNSKVRQTFHKSCLQLVVISGFRSMSGQSFINKFWSQSVPTFVAESQTITMFESKQSQHYCPIIGTKNIECDNKCLNMLGNASHTSSQCIQCIPHKHLLEYIGTELRHQCLCRTFRGLRHCLTPIRGIPERTCIARCAVRANTY